MRKNNNRPTVLIVGGIGVIAILIILYSLFFGKSMSQVTADGMAYLQTLEAKDPQEVEARLRAQREARRQAESEERKQQLLDGTIDVWSLFGESVIMGDSRAVGFYTNEFLPQARVLAAGGDTIRLINEHQDELVNLNPETLFLCYGLNDVSIGFWNNKEEYVAEYKEILSGLRQLLPNTAIYVNSILPAQEAGLQLEGSWANIPDYSNAVKEMCTQEGYGWVDCDGITSEYAYLYDEDGIHVQKEFYPYWAVQMMTAVYDAALGTGEETQTSEETVEE